MNLSAQFKEYLISQSNPPSLLTVKNYISDINRFIRWIESKLGNEFNPSDINQSLVDKFKEESLSTYSASSVERSLSSLRKFFYFLKLDGKISQTPFELSTVKSEAPDPWKIKEFKNHLYVFGASHLTIKNYIIDVKQFLTWVDEVVKTDEAWDTSKNINFSKINSGVIEEYKNRMLNEARLSPVSVNRKLSSIRRFISWANEEGLIKNQAEVLNLPSNDFGFKIHPSSFAAGALAAEAIDQINEGQAYSAFPPLRLLQKTKESATSAFDSAVTDPLADALEKSDEIVWNLKGRPVFKDKIKASFKIPSFKMIDPKKINNVPKSFYAPSLISTASFPLHRKVFHHARHSRPNWYKRYHSYAFASYLHFSILMLFISAMGYMVFNDFNTKKQTPIFAALPSAPPRILSFQGRLTDANDNPITKGTTLRMGIYSNQTASGAALLWQEIVSPTPDEEGIFSILLGNNTPIPQSLFAQNSGLWLGVTVERTEELKPRQQIATVAFAANAETLQGLPPITNTTATSNVVLALNSSGNLTIGGTANPTFQATGGTFTVSGKTLLLTTSSNGNIRLSPNGTGIIDIQKSIQNTSNSNALVPGSVTIEDIFSVIATSSGQAVLNLSQGSTGDLILASTSGNTKFKVDNAGNITANGSFNGLAISSGTVTSGTWQGTAIGAPYGGTGQTSYSTGDMLYASDSTVISKLSIGSNGTCLTSNGTTPSWVSCLTASEGAGYWNQSGGAVFPNNSSVDLLVGGQSTESAKFAILNVNESRGSQIATLSGDLVLDKAGSLQTTKNQTLTLGGSTTGFINLDSGSGLITLSDATNINGNTSITGALASSDLATFNGGLTVPSGQTTTFANFTSDGGIFYGNGSGVLAQATAGTNTQCLLGGTTPTFGSCNQSGLESFWGQSNGALYPNNSTVDLLVGGQSTTSAKFAVLNVAGGTPTASISGNSGNIASYLTGLGQLATTNRQSLTIGNNSTNDTTGNVLINSNGQGNVGIGTTAPGGALEIEMAAGGINLILDKATTNSQLSFAEAGTGKWLQYLQASDDSFRIRDQDAGLDIMTFDNNANIGIGTTTPTSQLHLTRPLTFGATGKALAIFDQIENQDIFTASKSGVTQFKIASDGDLLPGTDNTQSIGASSSGRFKDIFLGPSSMHVQCTTGDGCGQGLDYALGVNTTTGTLSIGVNGTTSVGNPLLSITQGGNVTTTGDLTISGGNITNAITLDSTLTTTGTLTANGTLDANGLFTLGDTGETGAIDTSDWDISTTGDLTGIGAITTDGTVTLGGTTLDINSTTVSIADTDISFDGASTTFTTTGDLTIQSGGGQVLFADADTFAIGGVAAGLAYNAISDAAGATSHALASDDDLFVEGDIEVNGTLWADGALTVAGAITEGGSAVLSAADIDTCAEFILLVASTGTCGTTVFSVSPTLTGTLTAAVANFSGAVTSTTLDTGQGANELYDMDQNVLTTSSPTFVDLTLTGGDIIGATADIDLGEAIANRITLDTDASGWLQLGANIDSILEADGDFAFNVYNTTAITDFEIINSGATDKIRVGINTSTPQSVLHVNGAIAGKALVTLNETGNQDIFTASASGVTQFTIERNGDINTTGDLALNGDDITTDGDLTINPAGGQILFADTDTFAIGGVAAGLVYNAISDAAGATSHALASDDDLFVEGDIEVNGTLFADGALTVAGAITEGGSAVLSAADIDTCAEFILLVASTGTCGTTVFSVSPTLTGTLTAAVANFSGAVGISATGTALTLSGAATTAINISNTGVTTDINLQNSETIDNNTDGVIKLTGMGYITNDFGIASASGVPAPYNNTNIVPNPSFEVLSGGTIADGWTSGGTVSRLANGTANHDGAYGISLSAAAATSANIVSNRQPASPSTIYTISVWAKVDTACGDGFYLRAFWNDEWGNSAGSSDAFGNSGAVTTSWALYSGQVTSSATAYNVRAQIYNNLPNNTCTLYVDQFSIRPMIDGDLALNGDLFVGSTTETIAAAGFTLDNNDAFIEGLLGVEGTIYTDTGLDINNSTLTISSAGVVAGTLNIDSTAVTIADTDIAFDGASTTFTTTGDLTIQSGGGQVLFADTDTFAIGGVAAGLAYNAISDAAGATSHALASDDDLFVEGDIEANGMIWADGGITGTLTGSATDLSCTDCIGDTQLAFNTGQALTTASSPSFAGLTVTGALAQSGGYAYLGNYNSASTYPTAGTALATAWNFSGGGRDISFWNTDTTPASTSFVFRQLTGASTRTDLLTIAGSGAVTFAGALSGITTITASGLILSTGGPIRVEGAEASDGILQVYSDNGDDVGDKWAIKADAAAEDLHFTQNGTVEMRLDGAGNLFITGTCDDSGGVNSCADYAEVYLSDGSSNMQAGEIVSLSNSSARKVRLADSSARSKIIGVFSDKPGLLIGDSDGIKIGAGTTSQLDENEIPVALTGRVSIKVSSENGAINIGDALTVSSIPGVAMKATTPGMIIGRAMETYSEETQGEITIFINVGWFDPDVQLADSGYLTLAPTIDNDFEVKRNTGETVQRIGAFSDLVVARIKSGYFETGKLLVTGSASVKNLTTETLASTIGNFSQLSTDSIVIGSESITIAGQSLRSYIATIVEDIVGEQEEDTIIVAPILATDIITPKTGKTLAVKLNTDDSSSSFEIQNLSGKTVASIDALGNASLSGELKSNSITTNDASISGTLRATKIIADEIDLSDEALAKLEGQLNSSSSASTNYITNNYYQASSSASENGQWLMANGQYSSSSASFNNLVAMRATFEQGLMAFGPASFYEASVADRLFVGSRLSLADTSINVLGGNLELQPLRQGGISLVGGLVEIDVDGNLRVDGNAYFAKDVDIKGKLLASFVSPLPGRDFVLELGRRDGESESENHDSSFIIRNSSASALLSVNNKGDLNASGAGTFNKLNLNIVNKALAISPTEVIATGSAGTADIQANREELTVRNSLVTEDSLIYITAKTSTPNESVYLLRQVPGQSFTVGISNSVNKKVPFNWIIIN